jgi:glycosidase
MRSLITFLLVIFTFNCFALTSKIERVEPMNWWVGMKNPNLQIMVHGNRIADYQLSINYPGVDLERIIKTDNLNYLFVNVKISENAKAGTFELVFSQKGKTKFTHSYELKNRKNNSEKREGFDTSDVVYLLMPDRFANGNPENDSVERLADQLDRENPDGRHGGDIQGIINHLDYLQELGITALWSTPLMEDNQERGSYHTYAITDYYKIDGRYGSNSDYARLSVEAKKRGIKLIMDVVPNHCGSAHWWMNDLPTKDWVHIFPEYTNSNHRKSTTNDPYVAKKDYEQNFNGWFDRSMPDLNQQNDLLVTYFQQNIIWWIEYADLGGIRIDTYPYNDKHGMAVICKSIMEEYPHMNIVGECWLDTPSELAYWQKDSNTHDGFNSQLPCVMDFSLHFAMQKAFNENDGWNTGLIRLYNSLAKDYEYANPYNLLTFAENHDTDHIMSILNGDINKYKNLMTFISTMRGIPQLYVGTEILLEGKKSDGDGKMRIDFPGGWPGDERNAFTAEGRTQKENEAFDFLKKILNWRKENPVIHSGKLLHFIPENNCYVYFRKNESKNVMIVINKNEKDIQLKLSRYQEGIDGANKGTDVISGKQFNLQSAEITLKAHQPLILELKQP